MNDDSNRELEIVAEFQYRRKETWNASKLWVILAIGSFVAMWIFGDLNEKNSSVQHFTAGLFFLVLGGISFIRVVYIVLATYRCPACDRVPMGGEFSVGPSIGYSEGVMVNPKRCPSCGARLR